jgi:hypothetical protein
MFTSYLERARKLQPKRQASNQIYGGAGSLVSSRFEKALERCLITLGNAFLQDNLVIEDLVIKGDRVVVKYRVEDPPVEESNGNLDSDPAVAVNSIEVLRLDDGRVVEHWDTVYQINTLLITV